MQHFLIGASSDCCFKTVSKAPAQAAIEMGICIKKHSMSPEPCSHVQIESQ